MTSSNSNGTKVSQLAIIVVFLVAVGSIAYWFQSQRSEVDSNSDALASSTQGQQSGATSETSQTASTEATQPTAGAEGDPAGTVSDSAEQAGTNASAETEAQSEPAPLKPSFDIVRVEPTGDAVLAGRSHPLAVIEILSNGQVLAVGQADVEGEWVVTLDTPLKPGGHDLSVRSVSSDGLKIVSDEKVAIAVPETPEGEVLVVANVPGQASEILAKPSGQVAEIIPESQKSLELEAADAAANVTISSTNATSEPGAQSAVTSDAGTDIAAQSAGTVQTAEAARAGDAEQTTASAAETSSTSSSETSDVSRVSVADQQASQEPSDKKVESVVALSSDDESSDKTKASGTVAEAAPSDVAATVETEQDRQASQSDSIRSEGDTPQIRTAETQTAEAKPEPRPATPEPSLADQAEPAANQTETALRQPSDGPTGEIKTADASAETATSVDERQPDIATTPSGNDDKPVTAATAEQGASGSATLAGTEASSENAAAGGASGNAQAAEETARVDPPVSVEAVEVEGDKLFAAGAAEAGSTVRLYVDNQLVAETEASDQGRWLVESKKPEVGEGPVTVRADELASEQGDVAARAEVDFVRQPDQLALIPAAAASNQVGRSAQSVGDAGQPETIIIRRGDNLWTISRRAYGRGVRYSTIHVANDHQIRDPHLIYPGQVFVLPTHDRSWEQ